MAARPGHGQPRPASSWCSCRRSRPADVDFGDLVDASGAPVTRSLWAERRRAAARPCWPSTRPQVLVTEMFPFGRRAFRGELLPLLEAARALRRPRRWSSPACATCWSASPIRARYDWMVEPAARTTTACWSTATSGCSRSPPPSRRAGELGDRVVHTGFVQPDVTAGPARRRAAPAVLVSAGGGAVGERLLRTAIAARPLTRLAAARPGCWSAGRTCRPSARPLSGSALPTGCALARHRADLPALMGRCAGLRLAGRLQHGGRGACRRARGWCWCRSPPAARTSRQRRARRLRGARPRRAGRRARPDRRRALAAAIDRIAGIGHGPTPAAWSFDGAARSAEIVAALVRGARPVTPEPRLLAALDAAPAPVAFWWRDDDAGRDHPRLATAPGPGATRAPRRWPWRWCPTGWSRLRRRDPACPTAHRAPARHRARRPCRCRRRRRSSSAGLPTASGSGAALAAGAARARRQPSATRSCRYWCRPGTASHRTSFRRCRPGLCRPVALRPARLGASRRPGCARSTPIST